MALNRDEVGLLLEAGGRDGGVGQDVGPLDTFEDEMVALRRHNGGPLEVGWEAPHSVHWSSITEEKKQHSSKQHPPNTQQLPTTKAGAPPEPPGGPTGKSGKHPTPQLTTPHPTHTHASLKEPVHGQNENIAN